jgi:MEDS: MEthanogen/methylotroph, DcmR Sensory domain
VETTSRPTGIDILGPQSWGTHFSLFYETRDDLLDLLIPYLEAGLANQEFCVVVASERAVAEGVEHALREIVPDFRRRMAQGQIEILSYDD